MPAEKPSSRRKQEETGGDLNLTPIMNLMVVLIPMLIQVAAFTELALLQYMPPAEADDSGDSGDQDDEDKTPDEEEISNLDLIVNLVANNVIQVSMFNTTELGDKFYEIPESAGFYNMKALQDSLYSIKKNIVGESTGMDSTWADEMDSTKGWIPFKTYKYKDGRDVKLTAIGITPFQTIIKTMDALLFIEQSNGEKHELFPQIVLTKLG
ncbi:hypothetical protein HQ587_07750 [bacterium]|nr:hypothetical protein [bacterium]